MFFWKTHSVLTNQDAQKHCTAEVKWHESLNKDMHIQGAQMKRKLKKRFAGAKGVIKGIRMRWP